MTLFFGFIYINSIDDKFCVSEYDFEFHNIERTNYTATLIERRCFNNYFKAKDYEEELAIKSSMIRTFGNVTALESLIK